MCYNFDKKSKHVIFYVFSLMVPVYLEMITILMVAKLLIHEYLWCDNLCWLEVSVTLRRTNTSSDGACLVVCSRWHWNGGAQGGHSLQTAPGRSAWTLGCRTDGCEFPRWPSQHSSEASWCAELQQWTSQHRSLRQRERREVSSVEATMMCGG